jgi:hypothetical protein
MTVPNASKAPAELAENTVVVDTHRSSDECKQKVGAILREWDWN